MSYGLANRHAFEALGRELGLDRFQGGSGASLIALASFAVALTLATAWILHRRSRPGASRR